MSFLIHSSRIPSRRARLSARTSGVKPTPRSMTNSAVDRQEIDVAPDRLGAALDPLAGHPSAQGVVVVGDLHGAETEVAGVDGGELGFVPRTRGTAGTWRRTSADSLWQRGGGRAGWRPGGKGPSGEGPAHRHAEGLVARTHHVEKRPTGPGSCQSSGSLARTANGAPAPAAGNLSAGNPVRYRDGRQRTPARERGTMATAGKRGRRAKA